MESTTQTPASNPSTRTDNLLFLIRWALVLLVIPVAWIDLGGISFPSKLIIWIAFAAIINLSIGILLQFPDLAKRLAAPSLIADTLLFGLVPFIAFSDSNFLAYFAIFPATIAAVRFKPQASLGVVVLLTILLCAHYFLPSNFSTDSNILATLVPVIAICGSPILTTFLIQHERETAVSRAAHELNELRGAMAGAKLFYQTTDLMNVTTSYKPVLETMLEAGVRGIPPARQEDGSPVGIAMLFDDLDAEKRLGVLASRNLERRDESIHLPGKTGVIAEAFQSGDAIVFDQANNDPELGLFSTMVRCRSGVCFPLRAGLDLYGVVILAGPAPRQPSQQHLELMQAFTSQAGLAFQNAKLYQASRKEQDRIIRNESEMRQKLARDLHDGPTQKLAGLVMQLDYISRLLENDPKEARQEIDKARGVAQQAVKEIRTSLFTLRPLVLESKGLSAALEQFGERLRENDKVPIQVESGDFGIELDANVAVTVFAIIEEAIGNARKHAPQAPVFVSLQRKENSLVAVVQDQGPGFDVEKVESNYDKKTSLGLQNMHERAKLIDGNLMIVSAPGHGTRITLAVPIPPPLLTGQPT